MVAEETNLLSLKNFFKIGMTYVFGLDIENLIALLWGNVLRISHFHYFVTIFEGKNIILMII